ncbi:MAG: DUF2147 domain-containing protein [bacterium]|nr:DUF2147 domain-containing protein [bacterium]
MFRATLIAVAAMGAVASPALAADVTGLWATPTKGGQIEISRCGASLCGKLVTSETIKSNPSAKDGNNKDAAQRERPLKNLPMLSGFTGGPTTWTGGKVYNADDGGTYSGTIDMLSDNQLKLKGCIVAPLCKTQVWNRVK